ncbi:MAG: leucine-rich repeat protein [Prevotellaceae bacterium]|jgi:hypothetical protein|nr:leucine-rich repeat protein [Prevotellaceae bacterium]
MKKKSLIFSMFLCFIISNLTAQLAVDLSSGGGLEAAVRAQQPDLPLVTQLTVTGQMDARDFRFVRDSLNATLVSLDLSAVSIVAYTGTAGTAHNTSGGTNVYTSYSADVLPQYAFYYRKETGNPFFPTVTETKMTAMHTLSLPSNITEIGNYALCGTAIPSLDLSGFSYLASIGEGALSKCASLQTVQFPSSSLTTIGGVQFAYCTSLQSITIPNTVTSLGLMNGFLEGCVSLSSVEFEEPCQITVLPLRMFYSQISSPEMTLSSLMSVTVPSSVTDISTAFDDFFMGTYIGCHPLNTVYESINGILYRKSNGSLAAMPKGITNFTIPATLTVIPDNMFRNCIYLTEITVLSNLTEIGNYAFTNCPITSFNFPNSLQKIGNYAFSETHFKDIALTNHTNITQLGQSIFSNCDSLITVDLSGLNILGNSMFLSCDSLRTVVMSDNLQKIPNGAFSGCLSLQSVAIPNKVREIGSSAFQTCYKLANVSLPDSLVILNYAAFQNDTLIQSLHLPGKFASLPTDNFLGNAFTGTHISVTVDATNPYFSAENGMLMNKAKTKLHYIPAYKNIRDVIVPATVDSVQNSAFHTNNVPHSIRKLTLPFGLKYIASNGLYAVSSIDTLVVKGIVPAEIAGNYNSLNNDYRYGGAENAPIVIIPPKTFDAYSTATGWKNYIGANFNRFVMANLFYDLGYGMAETISPNGNHVAGRGVDGMWLWTASEGGVPNIIPEATSIEDVNDAGMITGRFADSNYIVGGTPIENGGVYRNGKWYSLGLGRYGNSTSSRESGTSPHAITAGGDVYGHTAEYHNVARVSPFIWKYNATNDDYVTDTLAWKVPFDFSQNDQGGSFWDVSSDGAIAAGWIMRRIYGGGRTAIIWTSPENYILPDTVNYGEAYGVSPNGKYVVTQKDNRAAIYDVDNDKFTIFGTPDSRPSAVSDNGFVVGILARGDLYDGRQAFIWSERLGLMNMLDFMNKFCPDIVLPDDPFFSFSNTEARIDQPMSISADGLVIAGWSGYSPVAAKSWIICLADALDLIDRPRNLQVNVENRNKVNLSWTAPTGYGSHTLDFYYIYRDGVKIATVEPYEGSSFVDENAPSGIHRYNVSAVYDYVNAENKLESGMSDYIEAIIIDNYDIPFSEGFESRSYNTNYWTHEYSAVSSWTSLYFTGFNGTQAANFVASGTSQPYDLSLTSKPFDATGHDKVILAYMFAVASEKEDFIGVKDTVNVEIGIDNTWTNAGQIIVNKRYQWTPVTADISNIAANSLFRVRFRATSGKSGDFTGNRNMYVFKMDEFGLAFEESVAPENIMAYRYEDEQAVNVMYKDVNGSYGITYTDGKMEQSVGNEGNSIIAVNKYEKAELKPLTGKYLTSITTFLFPDFAGTTIPSELKLAVFVNGERVEDTPIDNWQGYAWNNFALSSPVAITGSETILAGIEAAYGDSNNRPLSIDSDTTRTNPKGNLFSEDGGTTWMHASNFDIWGNWGITANFRDEATAAAPDDDLFDAMYMIYKNDVLIDSLYQGQRFTDSEGTDADCYAVKVFRSTGGLSPVSPQGCVQVLTDVKEAGFVNLRIYPNPATDIVHIDGTFDIVYIYDEQGRLALATNEKDISVSNFAHGIYIFKTTLANGTPAMAKIVISD